MASEPTSNISGDSGGVASTTLSPPPPASQATSAASNTNANAKGTGKGKGKGKGGGGGNTNRPSPEEIEAKRAERALKKQREAEDKAAKEEAVRRSLLDSGDADGRVVGGHLDSQGNVLYIPRSWGAVASPNDDDAHAHNEDEAKTEVKAGKRGKKLKFLSWNILAQGLVRRKLFPGSDCLKFKDRVAGLTAELSSRTGHGWDVGCFQEVDRMEVHGETLERDGFAYVYEKGYKKKQHGLLIAWRKGMFGEKEERRVVVDLDREEVCEPPTAGQQAGGQTSRRTGCSRITRNVGLFVSLRFSSTGAEAASTSSSDCSGGAPGIIVATTHLFWHPMHAYERARQSGILIRRLDAFRRSLGPEWAEATVVLAGDFNDQPHSATYHLLTGLELTTHCRREIRESTVVHKSVDEARARGAEESKGEASSRGEAEAAADIEDANEGDDDEGEEEGEEEEEEEEEGGADDQMLKNCRAATTEDGLLSIDELLQLHDLSRPLPGATPSPSPLPTAAAAAEERDAKGRHANRLGLLSSYGSAYGNLVDPVEEDNFFGTKTRGRERHDDESYIEGQDNVHTGASKEPMWTIFSSLFSLTLDYIFLFPSSTQSSSDSSASSGGGTGEEGNKSPSPSFPRVTRLLRTHRTETLQPGVPRRGVCASDHVAVGAEVECSTRQ